jgi:hypothetical protein
MRPGGTLPKHVLKHIYITFDRTLWPTDAWDGIVFQERIPRAYFHHRGNANPVKATEV